MKYIFLAFLWCMSYQLCAEEVFPEGCQPTVIRGEVARFKVDKTHIILIHNISDQDIWLSNIEQSDRHADWSRVLQPNRWSALQLDAAHYDLTCTESSPGHEQQVFCQEVLAACIWNTMKTPQARQGTFWVGENKLLNELNAYIGRQGYIAESLLAKQGE